MRQIWTTVDHYNLVLHRAGFVVAGVFIGIGVAMLIAYAVMCFLDKFKRRGNEKTTNIVRKLGSGFMFRNGRNCKYKR